MKTTQARTGFLGRSMNGWCKQVPGNQTAGSTDSWDQLTEMPLWSGTAGKARLLSLLGILNVPKAHNSALAEKHISFWFASLSQMSSERFGERSWRGHAKVTLLNVQINEKI